MMGGMARLHDVWGMALILAATLALDIGRVCQCREQAWPRKERTGPAAGGHDG